MKLPKNRVFCQACGKPKILFESQAKANNFIKFNHDEILEETGKSPTRSYYCELCGSYHVTSIESDSVGAMIDLQVQRKVDSHIRLKQKAKELRHEQSAQRQYFSEKLKQISQNLCFERMDSVDDLIGICELEIEHQEQSHVDMAAKFRKQLERLQQQIQTVVGLLDLPEDEQTAFIEEKPKSIITKLLKSIYVVRYANALLNQAEECLNNRDESKAKVLFDDCSRFIRQIDSPWQDFIKKELLARIKSLKESLLSSKNA